jgi:hypothetical protein
MNPADLTRASLDRILALGDRTAILKVSRLPAGARDLLFTLKGSDLDGLLRSLSDNELEALASYLAGLKPASRDKVLQIVAADPAKMQVLGSRRVRERIIASSDQSAAVDMMLAPDSGLSTQALVRDTTLVLDGKVEPLLLWDKHPAAVALASILGFVLLFWFGRLFRPRRISGPQPGPT